MLEFYLLFDGTITRTETSYVLVHNRSCCTTLNNLTQSQWALMEQCIKLLKLFEEITKITSSGLSCIYEVIPHVAILTKYLGKEEIAVRTLNLLSMISSLKAELEKRFDFEEIVKCLVATFLDLRFKTSFLGIVETKRVKQKILLQAL